MFPKYDVRNLQAIVINYLTCFTMGTLIIGHLPFSIDILHTPWFPYALFLSFTFITFFNVNAFTVQKVGMVITSIFQKLSLVFSVILGIAYFGEPGSYYKYIGIILSIIAIILISISDKTSPEVIEKIKKYWYWPFIVLVGSGIIEIILFYIQETEKVIDAGLDFVSTLFFLAGCWGIMFMLFKRKLNFRKQDVVAGISLGIPNFFSIYLIILGLDQGWDGSVLIPLNNLGTIVITSIVGIMLFKEKLIRINYVGLFCAFVAVVLISI
jgi:drug/metabolite transporter (DMT)-like permease